jgi:hypothetical protein
MYVVCTSVYFFLCCVFVVGAMCMSSGCILVSCEIPHSLAATAYETKRQLPKIRCACMETVELHVGFFVKVQPELI